MDLGRQYFSFNNKLYICTTQSYHDHTCMDYGGDANDKRNGVDVDVSIHLYGVAVVGAL